MCEIKFRGKDCWGNWRYGDLMKNSIPTASPVIVENFYYDDPDDSMFEVNPDTVGQFTGLKDHKGREIYEGDIVEILPQFSAKQGLKRKFHLFAVVRWDERLARFVVISKEILDSIPDSECVSVIGNVHDTPELLTLGGFEK